MESNQTDFTCDAMEENIEIVNKLNQQNKLDFESVDFEERALFIPQCMRNADKCIAESTDMGYICKHCGQCDISEISRSAEDMGYKVYIVPGGRMVYKILSKNMPKAVMGIACPFELAEAMEKVTAAGIPCQGVFLDRDGCRNTKADPGTVLSVLSSSNCTRATNMPVEEKSEAI